jgi:hypothetical protein
MQFFCISLPFRAMNYQVAQHKEVKPCTLSYSIGACSCKEGRKGEAALGLVR